MRIYLSAKEERFSLVDGKLSLPVIPFSSQTFVVAFVCECIVSHDYKQTADHQQPQILQSHIEAQCVKRYKQTVCVQNGVYDNDRIIRRAVQIMTTNMWFSHFDVFMG